MIKILFDTNIWIYLANGYNFLVKETEKSKQYNAHQNDNPHFKFFEQLKSKVINNEIEIIINQIIIDEWNRNKNTLKMNIKIISRYCQNL